MRSSCAGASSGAAPSAECGVQNINWIESGWFRDLELLALILDSAKQNPDGLEISSVLVLTLDTVK